MSVIRLWADRIGNHFKSCSENPNDVSAPRPSVTKNHWRLIVRIETNFSDNPQIFEILGRRSSMDTPPPPKQTVFIAHKTLMSLSNICYSQRVLVP
jgi:hypothetical protein